jgi:hypothetical protein|tara:strand:+ start:705 stop:1007 length:303 start_codon:yes stop_codon:yes gene_type:complete
MSNYGFGSGPFSEDNGDLNSAIDAARKVMGGYKPDLPSTVTQQHVDDAALDVVNNAKTLQEKNAIIQKHFSNIPVEINEEVTTSQVAAFERIVMARIGRR